MVKNKHDSYKSVLETGLTSDKKTFDDLIGEKHAFVKFYSPNCGHCQNMASEWGKLGDHIDDMMGIYIIEVHVDGLGRIISKCKEGSNKGVPYIAMVKKGGDVFKEYNGNRSFEDMKKFITENVEKLFKSGGSVGPFNKGRKQKKRRVGKTRTMKKKINKARKRTMTKRRKNN